MRSIRLTAVAAAIAGVLVLTCYGVTSATPGQKKKTQKKPSAAPSAPTKAQIEEGKKAYLVGGCKACHIIGDDKGGKTGPDLTHVAKTRKSDWLMKQIRDPKSVDPKAVMPATPPDRVSDKQLKSLVAYLSTLK